MATSSTKRVQKSSSFLLDALEFTTVQCKPAPALCQQKFTKVSLDAVGSVDDGTSIAAGCWHIFA